MGSLGEALASIQGLPLIREHRLMVILHKLERTLKHPILHEISVVTNHLMTADCKQLVIRQNPLKLYPEYCSALHLFMEVVMHDLGLEFDRSDQNHHNKVVEIMSIVIYSLNFL